MVPDSKVQGVSWLSFEHLIQQWSTHAGKVSSFQVMLWRVKCVCCISTILKKLVKNSRAMGCIWSSLIFFFNDKSNSITFYWWFYCYLQVTTSCFPNRALGWPHWFWPFGGHVTWLADWLDCHSYSNFLLAGTLVLHHKPLISRSDQVIFSFQIMSSCGYYSIEKLAADLLQYIYNHHPCERTLGLVFRNEYNRK